jgi:hypothetical protein
MARASVGTEAPAGDKEGVMRMLMRVQMEVAAANRAIADGTWERVMGDAMEQLRPEAAYFTAQDGKRTGFIVFDLADPSDMPSIAEPFFMSVDAAIDIAPVMTIDDVKKGIEKASARFSRDQPRVPA